MLKSIYNWFQRTDLSRVPFLLALIAVFTVIIDLGYNTNVKTFSSYSIIYMVNFGIGLIPMIYRFITTFKQAQLKVIITDFIFIAIITYLFWLSVGVLFADKWAETYYNQVFFVHAGIFLIFIREFSHLGINLSRQYLNPAQLFILSFILIILGGAFLLKLPNATQHGIPFLDALFTSTSAVCVTGLAVVDTGTYFTQFGQSVILTLIQIGGLGIMTFASYFSYFFKGGSSFENQLMLKDMSNSDRLSEVFSTLKKVLFITLIFEATGMIMIYFSLDDALFTNLSDKVFFSVFHSISAFCNAGFSTLSSSMYDVGFRFNYPLHVILAMLFILGGLGFPIILNIYKYFKYKLLNPIFNLWNKEQNVHLPWVVNLNARIVIFTSIILTLVGTILIFFFEYNNTLSEHSFVGKMVTSFFGAVTPRTAGFNTVDTSALNFHTIMIVFILMWIGASPASTGGGIKTTTFAIGTLNILSIAKGKSKIELYRREIADVSVRRAFAIMSLSLIIIGTSTFLLSSFEPDKDLLGIAFECFSAYSTVGLSVGITGDLSAASKLVIIATMFVGRVSMLTLLIAVMRKSKYKNYRYPTEELLIN